MHMINFGKPANNTAASQTFVTNFTAALGISGTGILIDFDFLKLFLSKIIVSFKVLPRGWPWALKKDRSAVFFTRGGGNARDTRGSPGSCP